MGRQESEGGLCASAQLPGRGGVRRPPKLGSKKKHWTRHRLSAEKGKKRRTHSEDQAAAGPSSTHKGDISKIE